MVGPYINCGEPVVAACASAGADYVDITGEPEFVDLMWLRYGREAEATGARLVHSCGFDSIPFDLGAPWTVNQLPGDAPIAMRVLVLSVDLAVAGARQRDVRNAVVGSASTWARLGARARHSDPPRLGPRRGRERKAAYVRQPRRSGPPSRHSGGVHRMGCAQARPERHSDDVASVREHLNGRLVVMVGARPGGRPALRRRGCGWHRGLESRRTAARLCALDRPRRDRCRRGSDRSPRRRENPHRTRRGQDDRAWRPCRDDRSRVGAGVGVRVGVVASGRTEVGDVLRVLEADIDVGLAFTGHTSVDRLDRSGPPRERPPTHVNRALTHPLFIASISFVDRHPDRCRFW
jgi:hypothetical protein